MRRAPVVVVIQVLNQLAGNWLLLLRTRMVDYILSVNVKASLWEGIAGVVLFEEQNRSILVLERSFIYKLGLVLNRGLVRWWGLSVV